MLLLYDRLVELVICEQGVLSAWGPWKETRRLYIPFSLSVVDLIFSPSRSLLMRDTVAPCNPIPGYIHSNISNSMTNKPEHLSTHSRNLNRISRSELQSPSKIKRNQLSAYFFIFIISQQLFTQNDRRISLVAQLTPEISTNCLSDNGPSCYTYTPYFCSRAQLTNSTFLLWESGKSSSGWL